MPALQNYRLSEVAEVLNAELIGEDKDFTAVNTDSRSLQNGELFIALKGPNFDGHAYVSSAEEKGATAAMVEHVLDVSLPQITVSDTHEALGKLARARREAFHGKLVGLTGSNGKTTVKELIASILRLKGKVLATQGNLNNDIGLPLTLLKLENDEQFAVLEMGANHFGEISYLTNIACPDVAVITNAGAAHLEGFGDIEGVANAKSEIFQGLKADGVAIINADDKYADLWREKTAQYKQISFSRESANADVTASDIEMSPEHVAFSLHAGNESVSIKLHLSGLHNVSNALAAGSVAFALGLDLATIKNGLEAFAGVKGRQNVMHLPNGAVVIDDAYNANLDSVKAGIDVLSTYAGHRVLVLGDLFEVGAQSEAVHAEIGSYAKTQGVDELLAVGDMSLNAVNAFGANAKHFADKAELAKFLKPALQAESVVLVKGSRGMRMEDVIQSIS
ncbi:MAG: UDP-N-acetylmuramoyl-tripeptide--D-alanyl-D-alanine ligase [Gammaproteobacteria bacterium]|nr:UDP-N-acetylmuramoyl-tripeptide--D-alanyl-D-alanine ligase [Gammaproteobacteria bacterium]